MQTDHTSDSASSAKAFICLTAFLAVVVGIIVLVGWAWDIALLKSILPGFVAMKANTAACFILIGLALWLSSRTIFNMQHPTINVRYASFACFTVGLIGLLTLCEYIFGWDIGIDQLLYTEPAGAVGTSNPGRMAPEAAFNFVLLSVAIWYINRSNNSQLAAFSIMGIGLLIATLALSGLLSYFIPSLGVFGWFGLTMMAINTAFIFTMLGIAVFVAVVQLRVYSWLLSRGITVALVFGMAILVFMGLQASRMNFAIKENTKKIEHIQTFQNKMLGLATVGYEAQLHTRNYIFTGDERFKTAFIKALTEHKAQLDALGKFVVGNAHEQQQFNKIDMISGSAFLWFQQEVDAKRTYTRDEMIVHGQDLLDSLRQVIGQAEIEQHQLIQKLLLDSTKILRLIYLIIFFGTLSSFLIFLTAIYRVNAASRERRKTAAIRATSQYSRSLIEASLDPLVTISAEGKITDVNTATEKVTGIERASLIGSDFANYFTDPEDARKGYQQVFSQGTVTDYPLAIRHISGKVIDVLYNASVYNDHDGKVLGVFAAARDVTESNKSKEALRTVALYTRSLIEASLDPTVTISKEGMIMDTNQAAITITGMTRKQLIGSDFCDYFTEKAKAKQGYLQVFSQGFVTDFPLTIHHVTGKETEVFYNASLYHNEEGEVSGVVAVARDMTEIKKTEAELRQANVDLESFSYSVSHDLRAPLRAIDGFSTILREDYVSKLDAEGQRLFQVVTDNAKRMGKLIEDILFLSRASRHEMLTCQLDVKMLANEVWDGLAYDRLSRNIEFKLHDLPVACADTSAIREVLQNLLSNAIKFTRGREPAVIEISGHTEGKENIYYVRDNGVGFDMAFYSKLFGQFQRLHSMAEFEGTGVGLAIVNRFVMKHGGRVWAESTPDKGATFWFTLPSIKCSTQPGE